MLLFKHFPVNTTTTFFCCYWNNLRKYKNLLPKFSIFNKIWLFQNYAAILLIQSKRISRFFLKLPWFFKTFHESHWVSLSFFKKATFSSFPGFFRLARILALVFIIRPRSTSKFQIVFGFSECLSILSFETFWVFFWVVVVWLSILQHFKSPLTHAHELKTWRQRPPNTKYI